MVTVPLMCRYKQNISPFKKYRQLESTFYTHTLYRKVSSLLVNKLAQVFTSGEFMFVAPMKSKSDGGIGIIDLCDKHGIPAELRYDNAKEESMPETMIKIIMRNFYIIGRSSQPYTKQQNKPEGNITDL